MIIELKPCAKCGGEPELFYRNTGKRKTPGIKCKRCGYTFIQVFWNEEQVSKAWNTRHREDGEA